MCLNVGRRRRLWKSREALRKRAGVASGRADRQPDQRRVSGPPGSVPPPPAPTTSSLIWRGSPTFRAPPAGIAGRLADEAQEAAARRRLPERGGGGDLRDQPLLAGHPELRDGRGGGRCLGSAL